jgi:hypothetical protein
MTTLRKLITQSLGRAGVITKGETPSALEVSDGRDMLNDLMASMSNDSMVIYARSLESFTLSGGVPEYTIGSGGAFNTSRPVRIVAAYIRIGTTDYGLSMVNDESFASVVTKTTGGIPEFLNFDNGFPLAKIKLYPVPSESYQIFILMEKELSNYELDDNIELPPGWKRMLVTNLALEMLPEYGLSASPELVSAAKDSKGEIKRSIMAARSMDWNTGISTAGNIYSGWNN